MSIWSSSVCGNILFSVLLLMRFSFGTHLKYGKGRIPAEIVQFAASKLICGQFEDIWHIQLDDDQKLGMDDHLDLTPIRSPDQILFSQLVWLSVSPWNSILGHWNPKNENAYKLPNICASASR